MQFSDSSTLVHETVFSEIWNLRRNTPRLHAAVEQAYPDIQWNNALETVKPLLAKGVSSFCFDDGEYFRPAEHWRTVYQRLPNGVLAIKGAEVFANDIPATYSCLFKSIHDDLPMSPGEYLALVERKVPFALTEREALQEISNAADAHQRFVDRYCTLARVPVPVAAFRVGRFAQDRFFAVLRGILSRHAFEEASKTASTGLALYVYFYPNDPVRVRHIRQDRTPGESVLSSRERRTEPAACIEGWLDTVARLLHVGLMPCSRNGVTNGQMVASQNAIIDGGFADLASIVSFDEIESYDDFLFLLLLTLQCLCDSVAEFAGVSQPFRTHIRRTENIGHPALAFVVTEVIGILRKLEDSTSKHHPWIRRILELDGISLMLEFVKAHDIARHSPSPTMQGQEIPG
jgi:hypothetical protein